MEFSLRDFRQPDFETLWRIDQQCFAPGISYSRVELAEYLRRPAAFAIVAESPPNCSPVESGSSLPDGSQRSGSSLPARLPELSPEVELPEPGTEAGTYPETMESGSPASGLIVGFIVAEAGSRRGGHIITIDVLPQARKAGVGTRLLCVAEERLRAAQCPSVILETAVNNQGALAFYKRHEYHVVKTIPRYYSDGLDALVLKKDLLSPPGPAKLPQ